ncbi:hypothetical protein [Aliicoccus persicus]|uniref:Lipoprotein n=1 Tax=Aliicoccus persicus TaxID=930138 RepID=A0A662Z4Y2_9STAP|nr:hypothetical protein [Aliicoccus persicus]SEW15148.1 hypothetical protein SAMN05192557_1850 [Aliicoccus persicus]
MRKLLVLGASMTVMLAACGGGNGLEGNVYELEMDGVLSGTYEFGNDGQLTVNEITGAEGDSYEVTDDEILITGSDPNSDITIEIAFSYDDLSGDVIEGEIVSMTLEGDDVPEEVVAEQEAMNEQIEGLPYKLTKVDDDGEDEE